jgi:hypothetical protein
MLLNRRKSNIPGVFQACNFRNKPPSASGLKAGGYFVTESACKRIAEILKATNPKRLGKGKKRTPAPLEFPPSPKPMNALIPSVINANAPASTSFPSTMVISSQETPCPYCLPPNHVHFMPTSHQHPSLSHQFIPVQSSLIPTPMYIPQPSSINPLDVHMNIHQQSLYHHYGRYLPVSSPEMFSYSMPSIPSTQLVTGSHFISPQPHFTIGTNQPPRLTSQILGYSETSTQSQTSSSTVESKFFTINNKQ